MSEVKQYPTWQKYLRQSQSIRDLLATEREKKASEEKAEAAREIGLDLQKALMHFGVYVETAPIENDVEVDGYHFRLFQGNYRTYKEPYTDGETREVFDFTLVVAKAIPGRTDPDDDTQRYRQIVVNTRHLPRGTGWDYYLCQLADAFDELDAAVLYDLQRDLERLKKAEEARLNPPREAESADEKLLTLLRSIIRAEIANELYV